MVVLIYPVTQLENNVDFGILYFGLFHGPHIIVLHVPIWFWILEYSLSLAWYSLGREALNLYPFGNNIIFCLYIVKQF